MADEPNDDEPKPLKLDGFDAALLGRALIWWPAPSGGASRLEVLVYDRGRMVELLVEAGMDWEDAEEHVGFNIDCAYVGPTTPILVVRRSMAEIENEEEQG